MALGLGTIALIVAAGYVFTRKPKGKGKVYDFPASFPEEWDGRTVELVPNRKYRLPGAEANEAGMTTMTITEFFALEEGGYEEQEQQDFQAEAMPTIEVADTDDRALICFAGTGGIACVEIVARERKSKAERAAITIAEDCSEWDMPEEWIVQVGRPKFEAAVDEAFEMAAEGEPMLIDPIAVTHYILEDELGDCPPPQTRFTDVSSALPQDDPNYYPLDAILGLYGHVYESVDFALARISESGDPNAATIFEIEEE